MTFRRVASGCLALMGLLLATSVPAGAGTVEERAPRVLVLSLPTLEWGELYGGDTPALDGLLDGAAVGALSVRDVLPETDAADGYATLSAG